MAEKCLHAEIARPILERVLKEPTCLPRSHMLCTAILGEPKAGDECAREFGIETGGNDSDRADTADTAVANAVGASRGHDQRG